MKKLSITVVSVLLAATPAFAAAALTAPPAGSGVSQFSVSGPRTLALEILSGGQTVATVELAPGQTNIQAASFRYSGGVMTASGHVSVSVTRNGQSVFHLSAEEARFSVPQPK